MKEQKISLLQKKEKKSASGASPTLTSKQQRVIHLVNSQNFNI